jgi:DNA polymerase-3 subunit gamma/tau
MYQALYRKYRPRDFSEVVSQDHITQTLSGEIKSGKTAHAYLFTGSRGTGTTPCARIFAQAVNCLAPVDGSPCHKCEICKEAENGTLPDITEIDAASNNGVGDVRELRDFAVYAPERCKFKVYIIDEVHMLTKDAFNALLKITEEPPPHVKFILATTEIHKVLPTVISRCQRFDFRRVSVDDIISRLMFVAKAEQITITQNAAALIAKTADGAMRDALSLLDTCLAFDQNVTIETVSDACGIAGRDALFSLLRAIEDKDAGEAVRITGELYELSKDLSRLCDELIDQYRNIMLLKTLPGSEDNIICLPEELEILKGLAARMSLDNIVKKLETLQAAAQIMLRAASKRAELEITLIRLCGQMQTAAGSPELLDKISRLEAKISALENSATPAPRGQRPAAAYNSAPPPREEAEPIPAENTGGKPPEKLREWTEILEVYANMGSRLVSAALRGSRAVIDGNTIGIIYKNAFFGDLIKKDENLANLRKAIFEVIGKNCVIKSRLEAADAASAEAAPAAQPEAAQAGQAPIAPEPQSAPTSQPAPTQAAQVSTQPEQPIQAAQPSQPPNAADPISKLLETAENNGIATEII